MSPEQKPSKEYLDLVDLITPYVSKILVTGSLNNVLKKKGLSPESFGRQQRMEVVEEVMNALRLFCDKEKLPELMVKLANYCQDE